MIRIPKIIHYCWFGGGEKNGKIRKCIASWKINNPEYEIIEWNENNCNLDDNPYVAEAYKNRNYAFVSDFYRLQALKKIGGLYLDTDVFCYKNFDPLLENGLVLGYMYKSLLGTAVIGAEKGNIHICNLLEYYNNSCMEGYDKFVVNNCRTGEMFECNNNNDLFTWYFINNIDGFKLNGKKFFDGSICILPEEDLEVGRVLGRSYSVHYCEASWKQKNYIRILLKGVKDILSLVPIVHLDVAIKKITVMRHEKKSKFYNEYIRNVEEK